jgi:hypothetical protein
MLLRVAHVRTDVSEERIAFIVRKTIGELGSTLAVARNRSTQIDGDDCGASDGMNEWQGKPNYSKKTLLRCRSVNHSSNMNRSRIEPVPS